MGKMKAIKILGILVFVMFMVTALKDAVPGFIDGWNEQVIRESILVRKVHILPISL